MAKYDDNFKCPCCGKEKEVLSHFEGTKKCKCLSCGEWYLILIKKKYFGGHKVIVSKL